MDEQRGPSEREEHGRTSETDDQTGAMPPPLPHESEGAVAPQGAEPGDEHSVDESPAANETAIESGDGRPAEPAHEPPAEPAAQEPPAEPAAQEPTAEPAYEPPAYEPSVADSAQEPQVAPDGDPEPVTPAAEAAAYEPPAYEPGPDTITTDEPDLDATAVRPAVADYSPTPPAGAIDSEAEGPVPAVTQESASETGTVAAGGVAADAAAAGAAAVDEPPSRDYQLYRTDSDTRPITTPSDTPETAELSQEEILAAERAERKAARDKALGNVPRSPEAELAPPPQARTTDKFLGSLGLFVLRLLVAGLVGLRGLQHLTNLTQTNDLITGTWLADYFDPAVLAVVLGAGELLIALGLILGLLVRVAGLGVTAISVLALVFVLWGNGNPFADRTFGFLGEYDLLLAGVGVLFMCLGGGGWAIDRSFRKSRQARKDEKASV